MFWKDRQVGPFAHFDAYYPTGSLWRLPGVLMPSPGASRRPLLICCISKLTLNLTLCPQEQHASLTKVYDSALLQVGLLKW